MLDQTSCPTTATVTALAQVARLWRVTLFETLRKDAVRCYARAELPTELRVWRRRCVLGIIFQIVVVTGRYWVRFTIDRQVHHP